MNKKEMEIYVSDRDHQSKGTRGAETACIYGDL